MYEELIKDLRQGGRVMDECKVCANADNEYCFACDNGNQFKPMTNADRIRGMSDEELADFLGRIFTIERDVWGDYDPRTVVTQEPRVEVRDREGMLDWLKSPVEVDDGIH